MSPSRTGFSTRRARPSGDALGQSRLSSGVTDVRQGKLIELRSGRGTDPTEGRGPSRGHVRPTAGQPGHRNLFRCIDRDADAGRLNSRSTRGPSSCRRRVIVFPGSNCDRDIAVALRKCRGLRSPADLASPRPRLPTPRSDRLAQAGFPMATICASAPSPQTPRS